MSQSSRNKFANALSEDRLGQAHNSLEAFQKAVDGSTADKEKQYTLVLVTEPNTKRMLIGKKHRGFGHGMFNSFGGKIDPADPSPACGACRELLEETGIDVPLSLMTASKVGVLHFTFEDSPTKMTVHLFRVNVDASMAANKENGSTTAANSSNNRTFKLNPNVIRGCEEITPLWIENWYDLPLHNMHADDSVWLTHLLETKEDLFLDGYFHFHAGGQDVNRMKHYYVDSRPRGEAVAASLHPLFQVSYRSDPTVRTGEEDPRHGVLCDSRLVVLQTSGTQLLDRLCHNQEAYKQAILEGGRVSKVAVTDFLIRSFVALTQQQANNNEASSSSLRLTLERIDLRVGDSPSPYRRRRGSTEVLPPYLLERTDIGWTDSTNQFYWYLRLGLWRPRGAMNGDISSLHDMEASQLTNTILHMLHSFFEHQNVSGLLTHVAVATCQDRLRQALIDAGGVAFVAKGSILPRKSGASQAPMASPPAIPFEAPPNSPTLNRSLTIDLGRLRPFIDLAGSASQMDVDEATTVTLEGLFIPTGITLICGGGYHGKSTLLRCIAAGVYNKIPGDGREYSVTRTDALSVRAEDGRYVQNCNISAFISNLPSLPGGTQNSVDTKHFSTKEASGSTSQAANVVEALELGCKVMLVDEDVSAANFMSRDGRMRALVMDESITPLLYRVNGLFGTLGVSSVVVVGGVGDWLDVPHQVLLMDKYRCTDATAKAKSVSKQFSHGHVQYAGRGVVHRLPWEASGTPIPRRPTDAFCEEHDYANRQVVLLDGGNGLALYRNKDDDSDAMDEDEEDPWIDMSRCEQLLGRKSQLFGCGLAVLGLFRLSRQHPDKGLAALLDEWDRLVDQNGLFAQLFPDDNTLNTTVATLGTIVRPRGLEVGQALCRLRGLQLEELPIHDDGAEAAAQAEEERKKRELLEMWNNRRKK